ncbi:MAG: hypothetical protein HOY76_17130 [Streptomyces sp.]|nr:hypothetical protein [Streptomyces sp.]
MEQERVAGVLRRARAMNDRAERQYLAALRMCEDVTAMLARNAGPGTTAPAESPAGLGDDPRR